MSNLSPKWPHKTDISEQVPAAAITSGDRQQRMSFQPQRASELLPPGRFITGAMYLAVVPATERHGELIAHLTAKRPRLCKAQMMGIGGSPTANQTRLLGNRFDMVRGA